MLAAYTLHRRDPEGATAPPYRDRWVVEICANVQSGYTREIWVCVSTYEARRSVFGITKEGNGRPQPLYISEEHCLPLPLWKEATTRFTAKTNQASNLTI